ncbi:MAG: flagellar basal body rod protein FlgB [Lachnospiraceae bacterium]|nr:flagellar basal body rod protein FlgB [Candidatus Merdinaster equi]
MFSSNAFDYINVLDKAADASALRNEVIANNIANVDTPGYKRQDVSFEKELKRALGMSKYETMDSKVSNLKVNDLKSRVYTDIRGFSYRYDKNSVDIDAEATYLAENQIKYEGLMNSLTSEFKNLQSVMK